MCVYRQKLGRFYLWICLNFTRNGNKNEFSSTLKYANSKLGVCSYSTGTTDVACGLNSPSLAL